LFKLTGLTGSVTLDGGTITVKTDSGKGAAKPVVLAVDSIKGAAVWTGVLGGQFSVHYSAGTARGAAAPVEFLSVPFKAADKEWWDAMAAAVMGAVRRTRSAAASPAAETAAAAAGEAIPPAPPNFDSWLNRTLGLDAQRHAGGER
jgi:hypothetical protein